MTPCVRFKPGVTMLPSSGGARILATLDNFVQILGKDLTVSAGTNGHTTGKHTVGDAYDVRTIDLAPAEILRLVQYVRSVLGPLFYIQYEVTSQPADPALRAIAVVNPQATAAHVHVQVARNTVWPPADPPVLPPLPPGVPV